MRAVARRAPTVVAAGLAVAATATALAIALVGAVAGAGAVPVTTTQDEFTVSGDVDGLYPGAVVTMDAHVVNPWDVAIVVTSVVVHVSDASPDCPGSLLHFAANPDSVEVAPLSDAVVPVEVTMDAAAGEACRGASWPLEFTARALGPEGDDRTGTEPYDPAGPGASATPPSDGAATFAYTGARIAAAITLGLALVAIGILLARARHRSTEI